MFKSLKGFKAVILAGGLCAGLTGATVYGAWTLSAAPTEVAATRPATKPTERHPEIRQALRDLRAAKLALTNAAHDYKGHRSAALKLTDEAIKECEEALKADPN